MYFLGRRQLKGQEVLFVEGQNDGHMWAHGMAGTNSMFGTVRSCPTASSP